MDTQGSTINDYLLVLRRRKWPALSVTALLLSISCAVALLIPAVYRFTATILVEQQDIPDDLVRTTVNTYADGQIQIVKERVLTDANLAGLMEKFDWFGTERKVQPAEALVERMRDKITVTPVSAEVTDLKTGRDRMATISFTVSYDGESPEVAHDLASELTALFLKENLESRKEMAANTSKFLSTHADKLHEEIAAIETKLSDFKQKNAGRLPELSALTQQLMEATDRQLMETQREIKALREQQIYVEAELTQTKPNTVIFGGDGKPILTPAERLQSLKSQFASMAALYQPEHPDLVKMRKEIAGLSKQLGGGGEVEALQEQLDAQRARLSAARDRYSAEHPDTKKLERAVAGLESQLNEAMKSAGPRSVATTRPDNPAYIQLQARRAANASDIRATADRERQLRDKLREYEDRLMKTPEVEREYQALNRERDTAVTQYELLKKKLQEAELAENLENSSKGVRFSVIEPAKRDPTMPVRPNRLAIAFAGIVFSFAGGLGTAAISEGLDETVRGAKSVVALLQAPPLAVIPYIANQGDRRRRVARLTLVATLLLGLVVGGALFVNFAVTPLDVVWSNILERFGVSRDLAVNTDT